MTDDSNIPLELDKKGPSKSPEAKRHERMTVILKEYWDKVRKEKNFPPESMLDPDMLPEIWDSCFVVEANNHTGRDEYFYKYIGDRIKEAYELGELRNIEFNNLVTTQASHLAGEYEKVLATKTPMYYEGALPLEDGRVLKYRQILLPLGEGGVDIKSIMGGFTYKIYDKGK